MRNRHFFLLDLLALAINPALALALRVELRWEANYPQGVAALMLLGWVIEIPVFYAFRLYNRYWRYASVEDLTAILRAVFVGSMLTAGSYLTLSFMGVLPEGYPRSALLIHAMLTLLAVGGTRFGVRALGLRRGKGVSGKEATRVLIAGAGDAGAAIVREMRSNPRVTLEPVGFVDDDPAKRGAIIHDVPVLGRLSDLQELIREHRVKQVVIAMPSASGKVIREVVRMCAAASADTRTLPGVFELLSGEVRVDRIREVSIEDLLEREPVDVDGTEVHEMLAGRRVLITGAGGSIGSELCRQILRCGPAHLVALGHGENRLFDLQNELARLGRLGTDGRTGAATLPDVQVVVADTRDRNRLEAVFERHRPQLVFHAAAHKHVPLMEANPEDAVTNNVLATRHLVELSEAHGVERFVLISTDKAVNPTSVMGATKRVAELIVQQAAFRSGRPFVSVRFGNVLGSRGSVVPVFKAQIAEGGPVTVTHPDVKRYFMTIPEAVQLVLQAGAMGRQGEVFVLDMGEPIRIADLAKDLIELSGLKVGEDIDIEFTGLRPGEKLFEELYADGEHYARTKHEKILVVRNGATEGHGTTATESTDSHGIKSGGKIP